MAALLSEEEIGTALDGLPGWRRVDRSLTRTVQLPTFPAAIEVVNRVAEAAEQANHHPDIDIRWRKVTFTCSTHSQGGITTLDVDLARTIDSLAEAAGGH